MVKPHVLIHLTNLLSNFKNCFLELALQQQEWMQNPFAITMDVIMSPFYTSQGISDASFLSYIPQDQV